MTTGAAAGTAGVGGASTTVVQPAARASKPIAAHRMAAA
jgi:hypothetical protein